jgi:hypothetical protein
VAQGVGPEFKPQYCKKKKKEKKWFLWALSGWLSDLPSGFIFFFLGGKYWDLASETNAC